MVAAAIASYPLIDLSSDVNTKFIDRSVNIFDDNSQNAKSEASIDSDNEMTSSTAEYQQQQKSQAQRKAFADYLKNSETRQQRTEQLGLPPEILEIGKTRKIIDEVRSYQQELFERALEENIIAVLDTGSGKTLIACLLVRHILAEEVIHRAEGKCPRIVCFLACSVHLVHQQARVLSENLTTQPVVFVGDDKAEVWKSKSLWLKLIDNSTPVVCTPAVLRHCLDLALIRIEQISLLVFDEAHHAKKNHPYSIIIRSHYLQCVKEQRPKLFGMTASPVNAKANIDANVGDLEDLLDCKIVTTNDPSKLSFVPKPKDVIWTYSRLKPRFDTDLYRALRSKLSVYKDPSLQKGFAFAKEATSTLGPWCADRVWRYVIGYTELEAMGFFKRFENSATYEAIQNTAEKEKTIMDVQEAIELVLESETAIPVAVSTHLSSKVLKLYEELHRVFSAVPLTRAIVFVDQRFTAQVLNDCFNRLNVPHLRSAILLGTAQDPRSLKKQEKFLDDFRAGLINLIFATSVGDEGIDIPKCNLCIRFDLYKSPIQYIQSRGRARMQNSTYAHMIEEGNSLQENEVSYAINSDKYIRQYCEQLKPDRLLGRGTNLQRMIARDSSKKSFKTGSGAICDFDNSLLVLSRFASTLQYVGVAEKESYEEEIDEINKLFRYVVRLPKFEGPSLEGARGDWRPNKQLAKRSAAWNCCFLLRRNGLLDDTLNSKFRKLKPGNLNARLAISEKKSAYPMLSKPSIWLHGLNEVPQALYVSIVNFRPQTRLQRHHAQLVLLTRTALPALPTFPVYLDDGIQTTISVTSNSSPISVTHDELEILTIFTLDGVFLDVFNKTYEHSIANMSYWLAPPCSKNVVQPSKLSDVVDIEALASIRQGRVKWSPDCDIESAWTNKFICDPRDGRFHYFTAQVAPGIGIFDPVPSTVPRSTKRNMENIIDFSDSFWKSTKKKFMQATYDTSQPVLTAELLTARRNFLECDANKLRPPVACLIAPQPLEASRLDPSFAASCFVWPAIIHRLEAYMIALEAFEKLQLPGVSADLALEAFTKDKNSEEQERQTHLGGRHGMGKNYERLEFIGDSLLKMMTTITVFIRTNCDEEGMHCRRMEILCNRRLFEVSTNKHQLYRYARTSGFNRVTWYPENLVLLKGRGAKEVPLPVQHPQAYQDLGMKTIADISEAIIGAAIISSRDSPNPFDLGIRAITTLVDSEDHDLRSWSEIRELYQAPEWSLKTNDIQANKLANDVADKTGYQFRHPRLLRSAFTHSSEMNALVPDLQRLEFLGDAVLDWVSISWLFDSNPNRNPQWLTEHKMAMVSNKFLAALAVSLDFDKFIYCSTAKLYADIVSYAKQVREMLSKEDVNRDFWTHVESPPKALSDLVESYLGAVLVDSDFDYAEIENFFNKHVLWFFEDISQYDSFANRHPTTFLYKKIMDEFKCRDFSVVASDVDDGLVETRVTAGVVVHNKVIADDTGTSARYAKVRVSQKALAKLEGMNVQDFRRAFGCHCGSRDE